MHDRPRSPDRPHACLLPVCIGHRILLLEEISLHVAATNLLDLGDGETFGSGTLYQNCRLVAEIGLVVMQARGANDFLYSIVQPISDASDVLFLSDKGPRRTLERQHLFAIGRVKAPDIHRKCRNHLRPSWSAGAGDNNKRRWPFRIQ